MELSVRWNPGGGGYFGNWVQHVIKNWTQSDLRFCKKEKDLRSMKKGSIGSKIKEKINTKYLKMVK